MNNRTYITPDNMSDIILKLPEVRETIVNHLTPQDQLALRQTCHLALSLHQNRPIAVPYSSKPDFIMANLQYYLSIDHSPKKAKQKEITTGAWNAYHATFKDGEISTKPAMLYKLRELRAIQYQGIYVEFADGESPKENGRQYHPIPLHAWPVNAAWVLGQIHAGRDFVLLSEVNEKNRKRAKNTQKDSALAKEIGMIVSAGYSVGMNNKNQMTLIAPITEKQKSRLKNMTIEQINPDSTMVNTAINKVYEVKDLATLGKIIASELLDLDQKVGQGKENSDDLRDQFIETLHRLETIKHSPVALQGFANQLKGTSYEKFVKKAQTAKFFSNTIAIPETMADMLHYFDKQVQKNKKPGNKRRCVVQ